MHLMTFDALAFHGLEGACTYVQGEFCPFDAALLKGCKHGGGEMEPCRGSGYTAFDLGVYRLISLKVAGLSGTVEIGWNR